MPFKKAGLPIGIFVRDYLISHGEAYVAELCRAYNNMLKSIGYAPVSYPYFARWVYLLKRAGLLVLVRKEPVPITEMPGAQDMYSIDVTEALVTKGKRGAMRHYYSIRCGSETNKLWGARYLILAKLAIKMK